MKYELTNFMKQPKHNFKLDGLKVRLGKGWGGGGGEGRLMCPMKHAMELDKY